MNQPFKWTDDNFKKAVRLSKTNMTMTEIGRELGTIGRGTCYLCQKQFDIQSKFDRFCMTCKKTGMYVGS